MAPRVHRQTSQQAEEFAQFVREHVPALTIHVARIYKDLDTSAVVADVFATAWRRFEEIPQHRAGMWLKSTARNVVLNTRRGDARWNALQRAAQESVQEMAAAVDDDRRLEAQVVLAALRSLPRDDQVLLRIQAVEEPSSEELAEILGTSVGAARTRLSRARRRLESACAQLLAESETSS